MAARHPTLGLHHSEVIQPSTFAQRDDAHQIKTLTEDFPYRWKHGARDSIESLCVVLAYARELELYRKCGCSSWAEYCERYYGYDQTNTDQAARAFNELIDGVRILNGKHWRGPISETDARRAYADDMQARDQQDQENQRPAHIHIEHDVDTTNGDVNVRPSGNSVKAALRRLRKDRADLHTRVLNGELTANAAMVAAGFRKPRQRDPVPPGLRKLRRAWQQASAEERATFLKEARRFKAGPPLKG